MLPTKEIISFWFNNLDPYSMHNFWFDQSVDIYITNKYKSLVDSITIDNYITFIEEPLDKIALLLVGDQFTRNIYRNSDERYKNDIWTLKLSLNILLSGEDLSYDLNIRYFILLPLRHQKKSYYLNKVISRLKLYILDFDIIPDSLKKFYYHSIISYTDLTDEITIIDEPSNIKINDLIYDENYINILDPNIYKKLEYRESNIYEIILNFVRINNLKNIGVSLSGGVDSMVLLTILSKIREIDNLVAIHIEHTNRIDAISERNFLVEYCQMLNIKFYYRTIHFMNRDDNVLDRDVYENESKKIRFNLYKYTGINNIFIGHHSGDVVENVFTNMIKGRSLDNLGMMKQIDKQFDINIFRPMLELTKDIIFDYAHKNNIPYFKNSTPEWSCRGVIRDQMIPILKKQFGNFESNIIKMMNATNQTIELNEKYIIKPYLNSIRKYETYIVIPYNRDLIIDIIWDKILIDFFHSNGYKMISNKSKNNFIEWLKLNNGKQYELNKDIFGIINNNIYLINYKKIKELNKYQIIEWLNLIGIKIDKINKLI